MDQVGDHLIFLVMINASMMKMTELKKKSTMEGLSIAGVFIVPLSTFPCPSPTVPTSKRLTK
jgi:ABC-type Co2+ transport system permease subunit